jgi:hypothetical protein
MSELPVPLSTSARTHLERLPSALVIAGATAASYWLAHVYEAAFLGYFGLPASLVRVSTNTTLVAAGAALSAVWFAFTMAAIFADLLRRWSPDSELFMYLAVALFRLSAALFISFRDWRRWAWEAGGLAVMVLVMWLLRRRERRRLPAPQPEQAPAPEQPPRADDSVPVAIASPGVTRLLLPWVGREGLVVIFVLFLAQGVARDAGRAAAQEATDFFTFEKAGSYVVIRAYDDLLVAASLDREHGAVGPEVILLPVAEQAKLSLRWRSTGLLHRSPQDASAPSVAPRPGSATDTAPSSQISACGSCHPG